MEAKKDCILYCDEYRRGSYGYCTGLKKLYCEKEECGFYKPKKLYNSDGSRKGKKVKRFLKPTE